MTSDLTDTVTGTPTAAAPIVGATWAACRAILTENPDEWLDALDVADRAADLVDARPSLADELLHAAAGAGLIETRDHDGHQQVRLNTTQKGTV